MEISIILFRSFLSIMALFILTKLVGVKQLSQLTFFDYVTGISIGNITAEMATNFDIPLLHSIVAMVVYTLVTILISWLTNKSIILRRFLDGRPKILIDDGKIVYKNLQKIRYDIHDLLCEARLNGFFDLSEVEYAFMEINGKISFMPKPEYDLPKCNDLKIKKQSSGILENLIVDGRINHEALNRIKKNENWLINTLNSIKAPKVEDIVLLTYDEQKKIHYFKKLK